MQLKLPLIKEKTLISSSTKKDTQDSTELLNPSEAGIRVIICDKFGSISVDPYHELEIGRPFLETDVNKGLLNLCICGEEEDEMSHSFDAKDQYELSQEVLRSESEKYFMKLQRGDINFKKQF